MSISTIFPLVIAKPKTTCGRPRRAHTSPTAPSTCAGRAPRARPAKGGGLVAAAHLHGGAVGPEHDIRVEHREQRVEVAASRGSQEGLDDLSLTDAIDV